MFLDVNGHVGRVFSCWVLCCLLSFLSISPLGNEWCWVLAVSLISGCEVREDGRYETGDSNFLMGGEKEEEDGEEGVGMNTKNGGEMRRDVGISFGVQG